jgi:hypothetical protein
VFKVMTLAVISLIALVATTAIAEHGKGHAVASPGPNVPDVVLYSKGEPVDIGTAAVTLAEARRVATRTEFEQAVGAQSVIVLDRSAMSDIDPQFLHAKLAAGLPIFGLNVPRANLDKAAGFVDSLIARDPMMAAERPFAAPPAGPFYSFVWMSQIAPNGAWWSDDGEKDFGSQLFAPDLNNHVLQAQRLAVLGESEIVPLEQLAK